MECPYNNQDCTEVDTSSIDKLIECADCPIYKAYVERETDFMMKL